MKQELIKLVKRALREDAGEESPPKKKLKVG